jgi:hypothetical protein
MLCHECALTGSETPAVALCRHCLVALCMRHHAESTGQVATDAQRLRQHRSGAVHSAMFHGSTPPQPASSVATIPRYGEAIREVTDADMTDVLRQERVALVLTRRDCDYCATYLAEIEAFLRTGELIGVAVHTIVLDAPGARRFKRDNPWLLDAASLPYTVLYARGKRVEMFAASKGRSFVERHERLFGTPVDLAA